MRRGLKAGLVSGALLLALSAQASGGEEGEHSVPDYILHHVSDSPEWEIEIPYPFFSGHNPHIDLYKTFSFLRFETKPGACPEDPHQAGSFGAGCIDLRPTKHVLMMWIAAVLLVVAMLTGTNRNRNQLVPRGTSQNLFEMLVLFVRDEIAIKNIGKEEGPRYTPYLLTAFFFILFMNLLGLIPGMATATGNLAITAGLAICTFVITQVAAIRVAGLGGFLKHLTGGVHWALWPIMIPIEFLGLFTKPFALTVRLFANMLAGHIVLFFLLALTVLLHPAMAVFSVPVAAGIFLLEMFVAFVQAFIFTMLSSLFIGMSVAMGHHSDHDAHNHSDHHVEGAHSHDHGKAHLLGS